MEFSRIVLLCVAVAAVWAVLAAADVVAAQRSPSCATRCGNVEVPYPFGLDEECAINSGFHLNCSTAGGTTTLFHSNMEVIKISVQANKAWVKTLISRQCYNRSTKQVEISNEKSLNLTGTPYVLSADDNKVTVIGCNNLAYMRSNDYIIGCMSTCNGISPKNGSCSGAGCCQMNLPRGVRNHQGYFNPLYNTTDRKWRATPLGSEKTIVMEWAITRNTCQEAIVDKNTPYACVSNHSHCITNDAGYACKCSIGYEGNPYIVNGCTDIDECLDNVTYPCAGICKNTLGSFTCSCPRGKSMKIGVCVKDHMPIWIVPVVGTSLLLLALCLGGPFIMRKIKLQKVKKMKQKFFIQNRGLLFQQLISHNSDIGERMIITLRELEKATNNFDRARVVGGGGHGDVFKGILDLHVVAIKKSKIVVQREIDEFINEVAVLSQVNHRNVVKLLGCCLETEVPLLVYEFISNGTLYNHLHVDGSISLLWVDRIRIALEVARALSYLHSAASMPIFHRDIKSSNILLDDSLTSKVSDFGASRYIPIDQTGVTTVVQGTLGYLDPMYHYTGRLTDKSDVFSFGVLLVELLTRKKPSIYRSNDGDNLVSHFEKMLATSNLFDIIDPQVMKEEDGDLQEVATLAAKCTKLRGEDRPTMREVEMELENLVVKKKLVPSITTPGRNDKDEDQVQYMSVQPATNESSKQYTTEEEILLSASYPR
uniref:Protein kinase domain-containing protein n=1 Tax=Setaria italica TaxID=4555 RepID=K3YGG6_SETIT